jgi:hypothetical protein
MMDICWQVPGFPEQFTGILEGTGGQALLTYLVNLLLELVETLATHEHWQGVLPHLRFPKLACCNEISRLEDLRSETSVEFPRQAHQTTSRG